MSANAFLPQSTALAFDASNVSNGVFPNQRVTSMLVTNRCKTSPLWLTWNDTALPTAVFPVSGDPVGSFGVEVPPGAQVSIGHNGQALYVAGVLLTSADTGVVTIVPGDGI